MNGKVCVAIDADMYAEFILRSGRSVDVANWIERIVREYLDQTKNDAVAWSEAYVEKAQERTGEDFQKTYGDPSGFYQWGDLFLANGTKIRMKYKGRNHYAAVCNEAIIFEDESYSPSQLASKIADGTTRNAWRDLWIKKPGANEWDLADDLRKRDRRLKTLPIN